MAPILQTDNTVVEKKEPNPTGTGEVTKPKLLVPYPYTAAEIANVWSQSFRAKEKVAEAMTRMIVRYGESRFLEGQLSQVIECAEASACLDCSFRMESIPEIEVPK